MDAVVQKVDVDAIVARVDVDAIVARVDVGDAVIARPVASDGVLFVYERDGTLTALRPAP